MLLSDLRIRNYRTFSKLEIERLARVNLIAGRNNTGKSSLLEAAYLVANEDVPSALGDVLRIRGEDGSKGIVFPLFHGYRLSPGITVKISSGEECVEFSIPDREEMEGLLEEVSRSEVVSRRLGEPAQLYEYDREEPVLLMRIERSDGGFWHFLLHGAEGMIGRGIRRPMLLQEEHRRAFLLEGAASLYSRHRFRELNRAWDKISLTPQAGDIVESLKIIEPRVRGIDFLRAEDNVKILLEGEEMPVLVGSLGDGMRHLLMIALLLVSARGGVLLVDEVDTGLHYTVLADLWRLIFKTAKRLDVQVLATTHSWDCATAFSRAWDEAGKSEGLYLRLDRKGERIRPVPYTAEELATASEQRIEVR